MPLAAPSRKDDSLTAASSVGGSWEDPPPRAPWEEPPPNGWGSTARGVAAEVLLLATVAALAVGAAKLAFWAYGLPRHHAHRAPLVWLGWGAALTLAVGVALYLWQRLTGLGIAAAMLTDTGRSARLGGRPPVWLDEPPARERSLRVAHLSDLHLAEGLRVRMAERAAPAGNAAFAQLAAAPALVDADVALFTGDITDRGTAASWESFLATLDGRRLLDKTILVPGNHDLCIVDPVEPATAVEVLRGERGSWLERLDRADRFGVVHLANLLKFADAFARTGGGQRGFVMVNGTMRRFTDAFAEAERVVRPLVEALPKQPAPPLTLRRFLAERGPHAAYAARIEAARAQLLTLFPVAVPLDDKDAVVFVLNSSVRVSRHPASNALGHIGAAQFRRLDALARRFTHGTRLVAVHHHVVRRGEELAEGAVRRLFAKFMVLGDSGPLVDFCRRDNVRAVLNGHRHLSYQLRLPSGCVFLAAPSSTLGDELTRDPRPQFELYDIGRTVEGSTVGISRRVVHSQPT